MGGLIWEGLEWGGPDMGGLILYGACDWGPGIVRNVPNPAPKIAFEKYKPRGLFSEFCGV